LVHLLKVAGFPHPKVRQRVIEAFLSFGDPVGDKLLLDDLLSRDTDARQSAILQAGKSRDPEVAGALIRILEKKGMSPVDATEKKAAIQALAEIEDSRVLPLFDRMLAARHFLRLSLWKMLKKEILNSLVKYRDPLAMVLIRKVASSGKSELARFAARLTDCPGERG
jgi:HEAT repeat protein